VFFVVVYFVINSFQKLLDTPSYSFLTKLNSANIYNLENIKLYIKWHVVHGLPRTVGSYLAVQVIPF